MQAQYPEQYPTAIWDPVYVNYPVRKFPRTGVSSETVGRGWRSQPEVVKRTKAPLEEMKEYFRDYNITKELTHSQTAKDYGPKEAETKRFNKHTSCTENAFVYDSNRRLTDRVPKSSARSESVMKQCYLLPTVRSRLTTDKDQYKHPASLRSELPDVEPSWHKDLEPLDTTHEGFEKYLDPYLTTNRLHHRPFTADQLAKESASKDIITYYTFANIPWTRTPASKPEFWRLPLSRQEAIYDREKFKEDFREIRTHHKLQWVPGSFRTEARDNYRPQSVSIPSHIEHLQEDVKNHYCRLANELPVNVMHEQATIKKLYGTETSHLGSGRMLSSVLDQYVEKNRRLERRNISRR